MSVSDPDQAFTEDFRVILPAYFCDPGMADTSRVPELSSSVQRAIWASAKGYDLSQCLRRLRAPTLIIAGQCDPLPLRCAEEIHQIIRNSELLVFENSGHLPFVEEQSRFLDVVRKFLTDGE
jgi:proline iminopeptidase